MIYKYSQNYGIKEMDVWKEIQL